MAGSFHGSARTTPRVRAELQASKETSGALAKRYGLSRNTVAKWRTRVTTDDAPMGPRSPHSTVLTTVEEAMIVEFRRRTLLPLDDVRRSSRNDVPGVPLGTTSSDACATASPSSPDPACIAAWNAMASPGCPRTQTTHPSGASSPRWRSAMSTSTSASCAWPRVSSTCSSPSTGSRSSPRSSSATTPER